MTDAVITGPGLYVLRNGDFVAIVRRDADGIWHDWQDAFWLDSGRDWCRSAPQDPYDIIRLATPEEANKFCGGSDE